MLALQIPAQHGHHADREVPSNAAADLENPNGVLAVVFVYHSANSIMYSMLVRTVCNLLDVASDANGRHTYCRGSHPPIPARTWARSLSAAASSQLSLGSIWHEALRITRQQYLVHKLVRKQPFPSLVRTHPFFQHLVLNAAHRLHLRECRYPSPGSYGDSEGQPRRLESGPGSAARARRTYAPQG